MRTVAIWPALVVVRGAKGYVDPRIRNYVPGPFDQEPVNHLWIEDSHVNGFAGDEETAGGHTENDPAVVVWIEKEKDVIDIGGGVVGSSRAVAMIRGAGAVIGQENDAVKREEDYCRDVLFLLEARCRIFENGKLEVNLEASRKRRLPCSFDGVDRSIRLWAEAREFSAPARFRD